MRLENSNSIFKMSKMWYRKSSRIGYFHNIKHNANAMVRIESQNGKSQTEFSFSMDREGRVELIHTSHYGHGIAYKCPKFVQQFVKEHHDEREASPRMQANIESDAMDEDQDCTVKAIAIAAGVSYKEAHASCKAEGRINGGGLRYHQILRALERHAKVAIQMNRSEHRIGGTGSTTDYIKTRNDESLMTIKRLAKKVGAKRLTFNKLPEVVSKDKKYIVMNAGHAAAVVDGEIQDWSAGSKMLVTELIELK